MGCVRACARPAAGRCPGDSCVVLGVVWYRFVALDVGMLRRPFSSVIIVVDSETLRSGLQNTGRQTGLAPDIGSHVAKYDGVE